MFSETKLASENLGLYTGKYGTYGWHDIYFQLLLTGNGKNCPLKVPWVFMWDKRVQIISIFV